MDSVWILYGFCMDSTEAAEDISGESPTVTVQGAVIMGSIMGDGDEDVEDEDEDD